MQTFLEFLSKYAKDPMWTDIYPDILKINKGDIKTADQEIEYNIVKHGSPQMARSSMFLMPGVRKGNDLDLTSVVYGTNL